MTGEICSPNSPVSTEGVARIRRRVEHSDTDASGVVHFSRHAAFMEVAATELLAEHGFPPERLCVAGLDVCVYDLKVRYLSPARYRDWLIVEAELRTVGPVRLSVACRITRAADANPQVLSSGLLHLAVIDRGTWKPACLPDEIEAALRAIVRHGPTARQISA